MGNAEARTRLRSRFLWLSVGLALVLLVGWLDYVTGREVSLGPLYLGPILLVTWFVTTWLGELTIVLSGGVLVSAHLAALTPGESVFPILWNVAMDCGMFLVVVVVLSRLKKAWEREKIHARTDDLTGVANARAFFEIAAVELTRARRYQRPVTIAYLDLDNFKQVNDRFGHEVGDDLLQVVARTLREGSRASDAVARMGGDEFVVLFPETGPGPAREALSRLREALLRKMKERDWPVTFSIGAVTVMRDSPDLNGIISMADSLMYEVKGQGKDGLLLETLGEA